MPDPLPSVPRVSTLPPGLAFAHDPVFDEYARQSKDGGPGLRERLALFRRHLWLIATATIVSVGLTVYLLSGEVPLYGASALIRLTDQRGILGGSMGEVIPQTVALKTDPIKSQLMVLQGRGVLGEVVDREQLRLVDAGDFEWSSYLDSVHLSLPPASVQRIELRFGADRYSARAGGEVLTALYGAAVELGGIRFTVPKAPSIPGAAVLVLPRETAIDQLSGRLSATPRKETDAIDVRVVSRDSALSQRLVNATVEVFQANNARTAREQATRRRRFLDDQLHEKDSLLVIAQDALSRFRIQHQIFGSQDKATAAEAGLVQVDMRKGELGAERSAYASLLSEEQNGGASQNDAVEALSSAAGAGSPVIAQLQEQLSKYAAARDSLTASGWGRARTSPDVERLDTLIAATRGRLVRAARSHVAGLDARIAALDELKARNIAGMQRLPVVEAKEARLQEQVTTIQRITDQLRTEYQKARISEAVATGQVEIVNVASRAVPVGGDRRSSLMLGLLVGLMVGSGGALLREHLDTSIRRREEIEPVLRIPGLAVIPRISSPKRHWLPASVWGRFGKCREGEQEVARRPRSPSAEAYRLLRTNLLFSQAVDTLKTMVVTSAIEGEGKTTTAANLAITFAQQGRRVVLVDCDFRRPRLASAFKTTCEPGLTNVLLGQSTLDQALRPVSVPGVNKVDLLPCGTAPSNPSELLGGPEMGRLLEDLSARYDMLILDTPPLLATSDAAVLATKVDGVVLVVRAGYTDRSAAQHAIQQLAAVRARIIGAVLNDPESKAVGPYSYAYQSARYQSAG